MSWSEFDLEQRFILPKRFQSAWILVLDSEYPVKTKFYLSVPSRCFRL